jgi:hypothetical protein
VVPLPRLDASMSASPTTSAGASLSGTDPDTELVSKESACPSWQALFDSWYLTRYPASMADLEGVVRPTVAAVSWGPGRIDLFTVGPERDLTHRAFRGGSWSEPISLGGRLASAPAATAWAVDQLEVFAIHDDGQLWNRFWDGESWHPWEPMGGELIGDPAAASWSADRIDVFAPGRDGKVWHRWWDGSRWVEWERI